MRNQSVPLLIAGLVMHMSAFGQVEVHRFGTVARSADGVKLQLLGSAPALFRSYFDLYPIENSTDLANWRLLSTVVRTNQFTNSVLYVDLKAAELNHGFYRMRTNHFFTPLAKPTGLYAVGRTTRLLTDTSRTNRYNIATNSSFMLTIWYPADPPAQTIPSAYIERQLAAPLAEPHLGHPGDNSARLAQFFAFALTDMPVLKSSSPFPVVIYSHGYTAHRQDNSEKMEELASHGYVAVAMDHIDCRTTVFPDGTAARGRFSDPPSASDVNISVAGRHADDRVVVEELIRLNASDPLLAGRLDLTRLGAMGWSLGNSDLGELARTDERFRAVVMLDGYLQGADDLVQLGLKRPLLALKQAH